MDLSLTAAKLFDIKGRNALVTGGTSGIGLMMAKGLIANGVEALYITGNEPPEVFDQRIRVLHSFAEEMGSDCVIYGFVSPLRSYLSTR
jgi:NAD(P)-dependent dehydrogenase (short-subunit alcohol dehydrogenase family)